MRATTFFCLYLFFLGSAFAKDLNQLNPAERSVLADYLTVGCFAKSKTAQINPPKGDPEDIAGRMKAFMDVLISTHGRKTACNMAYVEGLIGEPGTLTPRSKMLLDLLDASDKRSH
jgi:hypothetical protein